MPAALYKEISRTASSIVNDTYDYNRTLKVKTSTANGVNFITEGIMSSNNAVLGKLSAGYRHNSGFNLNRLQVTTHGRVQVEASVADVLLDGLKFNFKLEDGSQKNVAGVKYKQAAALGAEYRADLFSVNAEADFGNNQISGGTAVNYQNVVLGASGAFGVDKSALTEHNVGASYVGKDFHVSLLTKKKFGAVSASFDHLISSNLTYAAIADYDMKTQANTLTVGGRYTPDTETTFCGKVNSEGVLSLSMVQQVRPQIALTTSAQVDVKNIEGESHKFGLGITLG